MIKNNFNKAALVLFVTIFFSEVLVMMVFQFWPIENPYIEMVLDGILLTLLISPIIYKYLLKNSVERLKGLRDYQEALIKVVSMSENLSTDEYLFLISKKLNIDYILLGQLDEKLNQISTLKVVHRGIRKENITYALKGTPCEEVLMTRKACSYQKGVTKDFPEDRLLQEMNVESYFGIHLVDADRKVIGLLAFLTERPLNQDWEDFYRISLELISPKFKYELEKVQISLDFENVELKYKALFSSLPNSLVVINSRGIIQSVNKMTSTYFGYSSDELIGENVCILAPSPHAEKHDEYIKDYLETRNAKVVGKTRYVHALKKDGTQFPIMLNVSSFEHKGETWFGGVVTDMTEVFKLQNELTQSSKLASIGELAAGVGHEINNPLAISTGNIRLMKKILLSEGEINKNILKKVNNVEIANERIRKIVDGLRTYARSNENHFETIFLQEVIIQTTNLISEIYEKEGINIIRNLPIDDLYTIGSIGQLQQVLMNLISNAKDALLDQEEKEITIELRSGVGDVVYLSVKDNGTGMSEEVKRKIFDPFFTTKGVRMGTGMGLGICNEFIKKMNGKIEVETQVGIGSTFTLTLPSTDGSALIRQQQQTFETGTLHGLALVIDDEPGIRELLVEHLQELGLNVDEAEDGDVGLDKIRDKKYDYICTDMKMPNMSGIEFIKKAKMLPNGKTKFFIITGGVTTDFSKEESNDLWSLVDGYIQKPFTEEEVYKVLSGQKGEKNE